MHLYVASRKLQFSQDPTRFLFCLSFPVQQTCPKVLLSRTDSPAHFSAQATPLMRTRLLPAPQQSEAPASIPAIADHAILYYPSDNDKGGMPDGIPSSKQQESAIIGDHLLRPSCATSAPSSSPARRTPLTLHEQDQYRAAAAAAAANA